MLMTLRSLFYSQSDVPFFKNSYNQDPRLYTDRKNRQAKHLKITYVYSTFNI